MAHTDMHIHLEKTFENNICVVLIQKGVYKYSRPFYVKFCLAFCFFAIEVCVSVYVCPSVHVYMSAGDKDDHRRSSALSL